MSYNNTHLSKIKRNWRKIPLLSNLRNWKTFHWCHIRFTFQTRVGDHTHRNFSITATKSSKESCRIYYSNRPSFLQLCQDMPDLQEPLGLLLEIHHRLLPFLSVEALRVNSMHIIKLRLQHVTALVTSCSVGRHYAVVCHHPDCLCRRR